MNKEQELVEYYFERKNEGMDFSEIRKELKAKRIPEDEIKEIVREIDFKLIESVQYTDEKRSTNLAFYVGVISIAVGTLLTVGTFANWINIGDGFIFAYGPILGGLAIIAGSKRTRSKHFTRRKGFRR